MVSASIKRRSNKLCKIDKIRKQTCNSLARKAEKMENKSMKRSLAALKGWEKRRKFQVTSTFTTTNEMIPSTIGECAVEPTDVNSATSELFLLEKKPEIVKSLESGLESSSFAHVLHARESTDSQHPVHDNDSSCVESRTPNGCTTSSVHKKRYTAEMRRQAAIAGWEKRRNLKHKKRSDASSIVPNDHPPSNKEISPKKQTIKVRHAMKHEAMNGSDNPPEIKRSRPRRTLQEMGNALDKTKDANELKTYLRMHRGWIEFHPSSRYGNGTADYAYIPCSIASFIRSGAFSHRIVLEHGTLGVHYALDYEGHGGLKEMVDRFGEDYSPYPSEKMMELAHKSQEKRNAKADELDLGEDLPWREVQEAEDFLIEEQCAFKRRKLKQGDIIQNTLPSSEILHSDLSDLELVAGILASLDCSDSISIESDGDNTNYNSQSEHTPTESINHLMVFNNDSILKMDATSVLHYNDSSCIKLYPKEKSFIPPYQDLGQLTKGITFSFPLNRRLDFKNWNFGLC